MIGVILRTLLVLLRTLILRVHRIPILIVVALPRLITRASP
jgi:hypothetical protein